MCNVDLSHHEPCEDFLVPESKKIVILSNEIIKNSDTSQHSQINEQNILQLVSSLVTDEKVRIMFVLYVRYIINVVIFIQHHK